MKYMFTFGRLAMKMFCVAMRLLNKVHIFLFLPLTLNAATVYTTPVALVGSGQSLGNLNTYVTLDRETNVLDNPASVRHGFRESTNQRYYALGWSVAIEPSAGAEVKPVDTSFYGAHQETSYHLGTAVLRKKFFLPYEIGYSRAGHYLLERESGSAGPLQVRSRLLLPAGSSVEQATLKGWKYGLIRFPGEGFAILWGSTSAVEFESRPLASAVEVLAKYEWPDGEDFALSFLYSPGQDENASKMLLNAAFDNNQPDAPSTRGSLFRVRHLLTESEGAVERYIRTAALLTPDPVINRANSWSKVTQLRLQTQYRWGDGFSNNPPSDIVVGRDSMWYLMGSNYYAQAWSRKLLDLWFAHGLEPNGKFTEYMTASQDPVFTDDYGLNINDITPLLIMAASHYYSLTGDRGFLLQVYPSLLRSAELIQSQRSAGGNNHYGLVWCTTKETFVRGLFSWRNAISNYNLSGAVTEVNSEAYEALRSISELAAVMGDNANQVYYKAAAADLRTAINRYLRPDGSPEAPYYLTINPDGQIVKQDTADELFPVLYGVADKATSSKILDKLYSDLFFITVPNGAGGFRTISADEKEYQPRSNPDNYGLLGGVWPNLGLWIGRAAAIRDRPDLALKALRATALITEMPDPREYNVVPGQFPEYFNGDDLKQRGQPLSSFVPGIFIWSSTESFLGITAHPASLDVNPVLPEAWGWAAASRIPYHGSSLSLLAVREGKTLYTTAPVNTTWNMVTAPAYLQDRYRFEPEDEAAGFVLANAGGGLEAIAVSSAATEVRVIDRLTSREVAHFPVAAGAMVRKALP
jgi:glycogen debranching enzyme